MSWVFSTAWERRAGRKQPCMFKTCLSSPKAASTMLSYLPQSALVGLMALDRVILKEWFVLCKVHIWGPAETWEPHIISCMNINCVMEEKMDPDWETASVQTVEFDRIHSFLKRGILAEVSVCVQVEHACSLQSWHVVVLIHKWCNAKRSRADFSSNKSLFQFGFVCPGPNRSCLHYLTGHLDLPPQRSGHFSSTECNAAERSNKKHSFIGNRYDWDVFMYELTSASCACVCVCVESGSAEKKSEWRRRKKMKWERWKRAGDTQEENKRRRRRSGRDTAGGVM